MITVADIRPVDLFDDLSDEQLQPWADVAFKAGFAPGDIIIERDQDPRGLLLLLEGTTQAYMATGGDAFEAGAENHAPTWIGAIAALTNTGIGVRMVSQTHTRFAVVPTDKFIEFTMADRRVFSRVMEKIPPVLGRLAAREQERERLAALGTMSAGLAHELNNPAAAAKRSAAELQSALDTLATTMGAFIEAGVSREDAEIVVGLMTGALDQAQRRGPLSALDSADAEDELLDTLEDLGVADPYRFTEALTAAGVDR
ncbi:MAG: hypothetical protein QOF76_4786, partial [Solirubrobacteraceae bacterium]|nr:hypothetical protein [Solirubrobacteraceae bacterium]